MTTTSDPTRLDTSRFDPTVPAPAVDVARFGFEGA